MYTELHVVLSAILYFSSDIAKIHAGIGEKLAILVQWMSTFIAGYVIAFIRGWQLALLLFLCTPFIVLAVYIFSKVRKMTIVYFLLNQPMHNLLWMC